jgi:hypothetical protein
VTDVRYYGFYRLLDVRHGQDLDLKVRTWSQSELHAGDRVRVQVQGAAVTLPSGARAT